MSVRGFTDGDVILLWDTAAPTTRAARLHAPACGMTNIARKRGRAITVVPREELRGMLDDLEERGYPVKACRCLRK